MTSFKYLVTIFGLLIASSSLGWTAPDPSEDTGTPPSASADGAPVKTTSHHKRHHAKSTTSATTNAAPTVVGNAAAPSASAAGSSARKSNAPTEKTSDSSVKSPAGTASTAGTNDTANSPHHSKKHHAGTAEANGTNAAPVDATNPAGAKTNAAAITPGQPAAGAVHPTTGASAKPTATTTGHRRRHGKNSLPQPPIVVTPPAGPLVPPSTPVATLPTPPPIGGAKTPDSNVPIVQTGLPVPRPGAGTTATLPIAPIRTTPSLFNFPFKDFAPSRRRTQTYPWKTSIVTTVFWIGEGPSAVSNAANHASAWDMHWEDNNGGSDDQYDMSGYASSQHASTLNPFYVALPFNDLAYPDKTARWLPGNWTRPARRNGKEVSACQGRWIEIKNRAGRNCFAQWEDVGPIVTDDAEYVFGPERPSASRGLDVSPAVAKYLGIDSTAITSWRFVDDADVQPGMWLRYDEQALLFRAIKEMKGRPVTQRIQDLDEPVPDPNDDSNQKKAGAARG